MQNIYWLGLVGITSLQSLSINPCLAQSSNIIPDNSLGAESSQVVENFQGLPVELITGGSRRGINLFHSFREFNVSEGRGAYFFSQNAEIQNILGRVTGNNRSNILGILGTFGNSQPNLFLINPSGIVFGKNASLDVGGSFVGTTADSIKLKDGSFFSASNNQEKPLLTISVPIGLQFGSNPGKITVKGDGHNLTYDESTFATIRGDVPGLQGQLGKTLALVGGDIALEGGNLRAESGSIELGSVAKPGLVSLTENDSGLTLGYSGIENFGDIQLSQKASVDASGEEGGSIQVQSRRLSVKDGSSILSITSGEEAGGDFIVNATESVELIGESVDGKYASSLFTESQGAGTSGNLTINTGKLTTTDGAFVSSYATSSGNGGNLTVNATESVKLLGSGYFSSGLYTGTSSGSSGNAGKLKVETGNLIVTNLAIVFANSDGLGNAGDILIQASNEVSISDADIVSGAVNGSSGDIKIDVNSLSLVDNSNIENTTSGNDNGGDITVNARQSISLAGGSVVNSRSFGNGNGGNITFNAGESISLDGTGNTLLSIGDGRNFFSPTQISSGTVSETGNSGNIQLNTEILRVSNRANIDSNVLNTQKGNSGKITVNTGSLFLTNGGTISNNLILTENFVGESNGGKITINARDSVNIDGIDNTTSVNIRSAIGTNLLQGTGKAGNIEVNTGTLSVTNGGKLSTFSAGNGDAGNITINVRDTITFDGFGIYKINGDEDDIISSSADSFYFGDTVGNGGDIRITGKALFLTNGGILNAPRNGEGKGKGGSIYLDIRDKITIDGVSSNGIINGLSSGLYTDADTNGGDIQIKTGSIQLTNGGVLSSTAKQNSGGITINARNEITFDGVGSNDRSSGAASLLLGGKGKAGDIQITGKSLTVTNGANLASSTFGEGNAGNILIHVRDGIILDGVSSKGLSSFFFSSVGKQAIGNGGDVEITANSLSVTNGAKINSSSQGVGDAGGVSIAVRDRLEMNNGRIFTTAVTSSGGAINITAKDIRLTDNSDIRTNVFSGTGGGGNINLTANTIIALDDSDILSFASDGKGGDIKFNTLGFFSKPLYSQTSPTTDANNLAALDGNNQIDINASGAVNGVVTGVPDVTFIDENLTDLSTDRIDTNALIANSCISRSSKRQENSFTITGSGGLRNSPGDELISIYSTGDVRNVESTSQTWKKGDRIIEPTGVYKLSDGRLLLSRSCQN